MKERVAEHYPAKMSRCGENCDVDPLPPHALQFKEGRRTFHDTEKVVTYACAHR